jgi:hypothetical protein
MQREWANGLYFLLLYRLIAYIVKRSPCLWEKRREETELCVELDPKRASRVPWLCEIMFGFPALGFLARGH